MIEKILQRKNLYYIYIATNDNHLRYEIGLSGSLEILLQQWDSPRYGLPECRNLVYQETFESLADVLKREKKFQKWSKRKLCRFINRQNPEWHYLNDDFKF